MIIITKPGIDILSVNLDDILLSAKTKSNIIDLTIDNSNPVYIGKIEKCIYCGLLGEKVLGYQMFNNEKTIALHYLHKILDMSQYYFRVIEYCFIPLNQKQIEAFNLSDKEKLYLPNLIEVENSYSSLKKPKSLIV